MDTHSDKRAALGSPVDDVNLAKGIVMLLNGLWTSATDLAQSELDQVDRLTDALGVERLERDTFVTKVIKFVNSSYFSLKFY